MQKQLHNAVGAEKSDKHKSFVHLAQDIYKEEGLDGLFAGIQSDTVKTIADSFLFFLAYNFLRQRRLRSQTQSKNLPMFDELSVGFIAGAFAKFLTTPLGNVVTRMRTSPLKQSSNKGPGPKRDSACAVAKTLYRELGLTGLWSGYSASIVLTLNPSLTFFLFNVLKRVTLPKQQRTKPTPQATFLLAAMSKAIASAITYPFSLAKTRLQVSGKPSGGNSPRENSNMFRMNPLQIFVVVSEIARIEGLQGLYDGLTGELLKGFFNHGATMLTKDFVHGNVIWLYDMLLRLVRPYPRPPLLVEAAKHSTKEAIEATNRVIATYVPQAIKPS